MVYRCVNDCFLYCRDEARSKMEAEATTYNTDHGIRVMDAYHTASCSLDPQTCGSALSWREVCQRDADHAAGTPS